MLCQDTCPRHLSNCSPLANVVADDGSTFVCCGLSEPAGRTVPEDSFRLCFVSETTDTIYDHDEVDLRDLAAVICDSLALAHRIENEHGMEYLN